MEAARFAHTPLQQASVSFSSIPDNIDSLMILIARGAFAGFLLGMPTENLPFAEVSAHLLVGSLSVASAITAYKIGVGCYEILSKD